MTIRMYVRAWEGAGETQFVIIYTTIVENQRYNPKLAKC